MKTGRWAVVCFVIAVFVAAGCAPSKAPAGEASGIPAGYESMRMVGGSLGGEAATTVHALAGLFNRYYPEIEWASSSGTTTTSPIYVTKGTLKLALVAPTNYVDAFGSDKVGTSALRSITVPRGPTHYVFIVPEDKPWKDITQVPKGANMQVGVGSESIAAEAWLKLAGLTKKDFNWLPMGKTELADAWKGGKVDIAYITAAGGAPWLTDIHFSPRRFKLMGLSDEQLAKARAEQTFERLGWSTVAKGTLTKTLPEIFKEDVVCPQLVMSLVARDDFPEQVAYNMAKIIDEHREDLVQLYPATRFGSTPQWHIQWAKPPYDIHAGVAKYYREKGYLK